MYNGAHRNRQPNAPVYNPRVPVRYTIPQALSTNATPVTRARARGRLRRWRELACEIRPPSWSPTPGAAGGRGWGSATGHPYAHARTLSDSFEVPILRVREETRAAFLVKTG